MLGLAEPELRCEIRKTPGEGLGCSSPGDGEDGRCCHDAAAPLHPWDPSFPETRGAPRDISIPGSRQLLLELLHTPIPPGKAAQRDAMAGDGILDASTVSARPGCLTWSKQAATVGFLTSSCIPSRRIQDFLGLLSCLAKSPPGAASKAAAEAGDRNSPQKQRWEKIKCSQGFCFRHVAAPPQPVLEEAWRNCCST